ncbi:MAG: PQQ-dependent sugar dehydrogenase [Sphingobacteriaceae bacterium]
MKNQFKYICAVVIIASALLSLKEDGAKEQNTSEPTLPDISVTLQKIADGFHSPIAIVFPENGLLLVAEQIGTIRLINNGKVNPKPFLDVSRKLLPMKNNFGERGLLGLALHPKFKMNKKFYVYYSGPANGQGNHRSVIAEYKASSNPELADPNSERILLTFEEPESNHNGGCLQFGPDGYLYVSVGDGGGGGDRHGNAGNGQNMNTFLGKILRIDVNDENTYRVPADNPFVNKANVKPEIWAYGLRNPWRFSFDRKSKNLFAGDVGQNLWEEVDIVEKGGNYGWRLMEGNHCFDPKNECDETGLIRPISDYNHQEGISVTGGYVYNGNENRDLIGKYIFGDWSGPLFYLQKEEGDNWGRGKIMVPKPNDDFRVQSFGEDENGELYIVSGAGTESANGVIYKIAKP